MSLGLSPVAARPLASLGGEVVHFWQAAGGSAFAPAATVHGEVTLTLAGAGAAGFITDDRALSLAGIGAANIIAKGLFDGALSASGQGALTPVGHGLFSAQLSALGLGSFLPTGESLANTLLTALARSRFDPYLLHNKDVALRAAGAGTARFTSDGIELRALSIAGRGDAVFRSLSPECVLRMALPFDRVVVRTFHIKGSARLQAHTDAPASQTFTIRAASRALFRSLETKTRCAKLISRVRSNATFGGSYG